MSRVPLRVERLFDERVRSARPRGDTEQGEDAAPPRERRSASPRPTARRRSLACPHAARAVVAASGRTAQPSRVWRTGGRRLGRRGGALPSFMERRFPGGTRITDRARADRSQHSPSGASLARSPQSARKTLVNAARPGRIYFSECLVRDHGRAKVRDGDFSRRWIAHGWPTRRRGPAKSHFRDCPPG
jgi:hypothetical protein